MLSRLSYHAWTLFLFTKSDIKTTIIPVTVLACASVPTFEPSRLPHVVFWLWLHVLQCGVSNQSLGPEEDEHNKSYRPLPAQRITLNNALALRWSLVPLCWVFSACYGVHTMYASISLCILTWIYNECAYASHWFSRNLLNAMGLASFEVGACLVAGRNQHDLDRMTFTSVIASASIIATTIQAQDFKDIEGDNLIGRKTLPIVAPAISRPSLMLALILWSIGLSELWVLGNLASLAFSTLALIVGLRFVLLTSVKSDQRSFYIYNIWLSIAHVLPAYRRFVAQGAA